jgi:hypothetical protein
MISNSDSDSNLNSKNNINKDNNNNISPNGLTLGSKRKTAGRPKRFPKIRLKTAQSLLSWCRSCKGLPSR